ncbi:MAG: hypothetical protein R3F42_07135 [Pseudomonadota bacterium]
MRQQILDELTRFLGEMEGELSCVYRDEIDKQRMTSRIVRGTLALLLAVVTANCYYLYQLSTGLHESLVMVDVMAHRFGQVTTSLNRVTGSVAHIGERIQSLDGIDTDMGAVTTEVVRITAALSGIAGTVTDLSVELQQVNAAMGVIDGQVYGLTGNVRQIGGGMQQMSGPMSFMNKMMPW